MKERAIGARAMNENDMVSAADLARELGILGRSILRVMRRLGISGTKRHDPTRGNQSVVYMTRTECDRVRAAVVRRQKRRGLVGGNQQDTDFYSAELGVFYLIQLEPNHDPQRFKVGFAANMADRLRSLRCSAPFSAVLKTWPRRRLWEKTAIDCVCTGCEQVHTEVFRATSIEDMMARCDRFFGMMPALNAREQE